MARGPAPGDLETVRSLVNTLDVEEQTDALASPQSARAWLIRNGLASESTRVAADYWRRIVALRDALRALVLANNGYPVDVEKASRTLNREAAVCRLGLSFTPEGRAEVRAEGALGTVLAIVAAAMGDGTWARLKACRAGDCEWVFYDASKNRSGAWCAMGVCGNRNKARAFRERQRATT